MRDLTPQRPVILLSTHVAGRPAVDNLEAHNKAVVALGQAGIGNKPIVFYPAADKDGNQEPQLYILVDEDNYPRVAALEVDFNDDVQILLDWQRIGSFIDNEGNQVFLGTLKPTNKALIAPGHAYFRDPKTEGCFTFVK